jgi:hypothetical protein
MFHRGAEIPGDHPRLEGDGRLARTMRFSDLEQLEAGRADLEAAIRAWCDLEGGLVDSGLSPQTGRSTPPPAFL